MGLFSDWFTERKEAGSRPADSVVYLKEKVGGRETCWANVLRTVRSHYLSDKTLRQYCEALGYADAAENLRLYLPADKKSRSGDLGEIFATEYVNEKISTRVHLKRLRYKDERDTALRGDDLLGLHLDDSGGLHVLKGESKSRISLSADILTEAETKLLSNQGRPSHHSANFVLGFLFETAPDMAKALARYNIRKLEARSLRHLLFALTQSAPIRLFPEFAKRAYPTNILRIMVAVVVANHKETVERIFTEAIAAETLDRTAES